MFRQTALFLEQMLTVAPGKLRNCRRIPSTFTNKTITSLYFPCKEIGLQQQNKIQIKLKKSQILSPMTRQAPFPDWELTEAD